MEALNYCIEWCDEDNIKDNPGSAPIGGFGSLLQATIAAIPSY